MSKRIVICGAQFGDPMLLMKWVTQTFEASSRVVEIGPRDRIHEIETEGVRIVVAVPAHWEPERVYETIFEEPADGVLLVLTSIRRLADGNTKALAWLRPHLSKSAKAPVVIANDAHGRNPKFPTATAADVARRHQIEWPVRETVIGNFEKLSWTNGAAEAWNDVTAS